MCSIPLSTRVLLFDERVAGRLLTIAPVRQLGLI